MNQAQQKTHDVEAARRGDEHHRRGNQSPHHHEQGNPAASSDPVQNQIARHLKYKIPGEEHSSRKPVNGLAKVQLARHLELGEAHVNAVEVSDDVEKE
jgi:hypothetical protein